MMALDDVVSSTTTGPRVAEATDRTLRWIDRCIAAHKRPHDQNLFGYVMRSRSQNMTDRKISPFRSNMIYSKYLHNIIYDIIY